MGQGSIGRPEPMTLGKGAKESAFRAGRCIAEPFQKRTSGHHSRSQSPAVHSCTRSCEMGAACPKSGTNFGRIIQATHSAASTNSFRTFQQQWRPCEAHQDLEKLFHHETSLVLCRSITRIPFFSENAKTQFLHSQNCTHLRSTASKKAPSAEPQNFRISVAKLCGKPGR